MPRATRFEASHDTRVWTDHRRLDAASDATPSLGTDVRVAATLGAQHQPGGYRQHAARRDDRGHGCGWRAARAHLCVVGPRGALIDNDEVAAFVREYPDRLIGVAS